MKDKSMNDLNQNLKPQAAIGKSCGSCTMCCKVLFIPWLDNKPEGVWCKDCKPSKGCGIWDTRPKGCADYFCYWIMEKSLGLEWKPDVAKFIIQTGSDNFFSSIIVDPGHAHAWKREPYYSVIKNWADQRMSQGKGVVVVIGTKKFILTPDAEVPISQYPKGTSYKLDRVIVNGKPKYNIEVQVPSIQA